MMGTDGNASVGDSQLLTAILDSADALMAVLDREGRVTWSNSAWQRILGLDPASILGRRFAGLEALGRRHAPARGLDAWLERIELGTGPYRWEDDRSTVTGERRRIAWSCAALAPGNGRIERLVLTGTDVTDRHRPASQALDDRSREFAEGACDWFWEMDAELRFSRFSPRFAELTGVSPGWLLGRTRLEVAEATLDDDHWRCHWADLQAHRPFRDFRYSVLRPDGERARWSVSGNPIFDDAGTFRGYRGTGLDISAQVAGGRHLREALDRFRELAELLPEIVFETDLSGRLTFCNLSGFVTLGYTEEDFQRGICIFDFVQPNDHERALRNFTAAIRGEPVLGHEYELRRTDGSTFPVMVRSSRIIHDGTTVGLRGLIVDITRTRHAELELMAAKRQAEAANIAKSQFLATMSHELRTPLNAVLGFSELIRDAAFGHSAEAAARYAEYAADIHSSGRHLLDLINDLLDLSKIEAGKLDIDPEWLDLARLLAGSVRLFGIQAKERGLDIDISLPNPVPQLCADERAVKQIVFNLLSNAIKFTDRGGAVIVSCADHDGGQVAIRIGDTGIGIPGDQIDRILQPFEQIDNHYGRAAGGTGLGLSLVKALVELHGGSLRIDSTPRVGTEVTVLLPRQRVVTNATTVPPWEVAGA